MNDSSVSKVVLVDRIAASGSLLGMALIERFFRCHYVLVTSVDAVKHVELMFSVVRLLPHTSYS